MKSQKWIRIIISLIVIVGYSLFYIGLGISCSLGGSGFIDCRLGLPLVVMTILVFIVGLLIFIRHRNPQEPQYIKTIRITQQVLVVAGILPLLFGTLYYSTPKDLQLEYFEGYSLTSCETTKPSVPWGSKVYPDRCYNLYGVCEKIRDGRSQKYCFENEGVNFSTYKECSLLTSDSEKKYCELEVAKEAGDYNYCLTLDSEDARYTYISRNNCLADFGYKDMQRIVSNNRDLPFDSQIKTCSSFSSPTDDICYSHTIIKKLQRGGLRDPEKHCNLISNTIPGVKENCLSAVRNFE